MWRGNLETPHGEGETLRVDGDRGNPSNPGVPAEPSLPGSWPGCQTRESAILTQSVQSSAQMTAVPGAIWL